MLKCNFFLAMTDIITSQNIGLLSWVTLWLKIPWKLHSTFFWAIGTLLALALECCSINLHHFFPRFLPLNSADGGNTFLRNAGTHTSKYIKLDPRRLCVILSRSLVDERRSYIKHSRIWRWRAVSELELGRPKYWVNSSIHAEWRKKAVKNLSQDNR